MTTLSLMHLDGRWLAFEGGRVTRMEARPRLTRAAVAITDFDGAVSQVIALEGSPAHAVALIEKRLRADGLIDNESKILIHQSKTVGNGYQALFTAVPLDRWQQMFAWAESHDDHCLLLPSVALLWWMLRPGRGIVLHSGRQFTFLANLRNRMVHASALAFSDDPSDLAMTVGALAERAGRDLAGEDGALDTLEIDWFGVLTPAPHPQAGETTTLDDEFPTARTYPVSPLPRPAAGPDGAISFDGQFEAPAIAEPAAVAPIRPGPIPAGRWLDEALLEIFSERSGTTVRLGPHTSVRDADGMLFRSGVARLVASANPLSAVNPAASRLAYVAERVLPWAGAASLVLALALGGLGGRWTLAANDALGRARDLDAQIAQVEAEIAGLQAQQDVPEAYPRLVGFVERAGALHHALDPNAVLRDLRFAAGDDVRILRLRLDPSEDGQSGTVRVDGMVNHDRGGDGQGMQIARFVQRLRTAGYLAEAVDPQTGNARSQSPGGSFSYQLRLDTPATARETSS